MCAFLLAGIVSSAAPDKRNGGGAVKYICSVAVLFVMLSPVMAFLSSAERTSDMITNFFSGMIGEVGAASDGGDGFDELRSSSAAAAVSESIGKAVAAKFGLAREAVSVSLTLDMSDVSAVQIVRADIVISEDDRTGDGRDVSEIGKFASELIGSPCTVSVK